VGNAQQRYQLSVLQKSWLISAVEYYRLPRAAPAGRRVGFPAYHRNDLDTSVPFKEGYLAFAIGPVRPVLGIDDDLPWTLAPPCDSCATFALKLKCLFDFLWTKRERRP
jgi:hypothetical protein